MCGVVGIYSKDKDISKQLYYSLYSIQHRDEISPDTCRLWDVNTNEKLDKDRFRRDLGDLVQGYEEVLARLNK